MGSETEKVFGNFIVVKVILLVLIRNQVVQLTTQYGYSIC